MSWRRTRKQSSRYPSFFENLTDIISGLPPPREAGGPSKILRQFLIHRIENFDTTPREMNVHSTVSYMYRQLATNGEYTTP